MTTLTAELLRAHILAEPFRLFSRKELSEPLIIIYQVLKWAMRDDADMLMVIPGGFIWFREEVKISELVSQTLIPQPSYVELVEIVIKRDELLRSVVIPVQVTGTGIRYALNFPKDSK